MEQRDGNRHKMSQIVVKCHKLSWLFFPVPFPLSPFGFRRFRHPSFGPADPKSVKELRHLLGQNQVKAAKIRAGKRHKEFEHINFLKAGTTPKDPAVLKTLRRSNLRSPY